MTSVEPRVPATGGTAGEAQTIPIGKKALIIVENALRLKKDRYGISQERLGYWAADKTAKLSLEHGLIPGPQLEKPPARNTMSNTLINRRKWLLVAQNKLNWNESKSTEQMVAEAKRQYDERDDEELMKQVGARCAAQPVSSSLCHGRPFTLSPSLSVSLSFSPPPSEPEALSLSFSLFSTPAHSPPSPAAAAGSLRHESTFHASKCEIILTHELSDWPDVCVSPCVCVLMRAGSAVYSRTVEGVIPTGSLLG
jgi:hypothetical protein